MQRTHSKMTARIPPLTIRRLSAADLEGSRQGAAGLSATREMRQLWQRALHKGLKGRSGRNA